MVPHLEAGDVVCGDQESGYVGVVHEAVAEGVGEEGGGDALIAG